VQSDALTPPSPTGEGENLKNGSPTVAVLFFT